MIKKLSTANDVMKRYGFMTLITYLFRTLIWGTTRSRRLFLFELTNPTPSPKSLVNSEGHTFRFASIDDLNKYHAIPGYDIKENDIEAFKNGDRCLLQLDGENLVGYSWLAGSPLVEIESGFYFNMADDIVYNYKGYTSPEYRGKGFQPLRHKKLLEHVKSTGQSKLFGYVNHLNLSSLNGVRKSGYKKVGSLVYIKSKEHVKFKLSVTRPSWSVMRRI